MNQRNNPQELISQTEISQKIAEIGKELDRIYAGKEITIVMVMKGAICFVADLIRHLTVPNSLEFIQGSSYGAHGTESGDLTLFGIDELPLAGKHILVVDDIYDSGSTLTEIIRRLSEKHPASLKSLVLLSKNVPRKTSYKPDFVLFEIENKFVVGYGLDYKEHYRGLPGVCVL